MTVVLSASGVGKAYDLRWSHEKRTLRGALGERVASVRRGADRRRWALRDVSFELAEGRSLGLIGHNGAGKSTLLRLASGVGRPTTGTLAVDPSMRSVLNLGGSFDAQLTGEENAYTAAIIAGLDRRGARRALDAIFDFSGLGDHASAPVRTYSEGMKLRLAFSVATLRRPRLLVLDEVLAVGDLDFRLRCEERIRDMQRAGTSVLLASHSLAEIGTFCEEAVWLHRGEVRSRGDVAAVSERYATAMTSETLARTPVGAPAENGLALGENRFGSQEVRITGVELVGQRRADDGRAVVETGRELRVLVELESTGTPIEDAIVGVAVRRAGDDAVVVDVNTAADHWSLGPGGRDRRIELLVERLDLPGGDYRVDVGAYERAWEHAYDFHHAAYGLRVEGPDAGTGVLRPPTAWRRA